MKNIKNIAVLKFYFAVAILLLTLGSCSNDDSSSSDELAVTQITRSVIDDPTVDGDRQVDVPIDAIYAGNYYVIRGSGFAGLKSVSFNGLESAFNPTFVTDNAIVIKVDEKTPYYNEMDELKIVTEGGTLVYSVKVKPPFPTIKGFPINPTQGDVITITGDYFLHPVVTFGTTKVDVISSTLTEIKVQVPNNIQYEHLSVTNVSGTTTASQTFGSAIYDDAFTNIWGWNEIWDSSNGFEPAYSKDSNQGSKCIQWKAGEWDTYIVAIAYWNFTDTNKYKAVRFSIKGAMAGKVKVYINGSPDSNFKIVECKDKWTNVEIPFSDLGNPAVLNSIGYVEFGGLGGNVILLDDIGLVLKNN
jgi:hypothetical protein